MFCSAWPRTNKSVPLKIPMGHDNLNDKRKMIRISLLFCIATLAYGCTSVDKERVADIDPTGWHTDAPATVAVMNTDTVAVYDIAILVRVDNTLVLQMLPIVIRTTTPDLIRFEETLNLPLMPLAPMKEDYYEMTIPYRSDVVLDRAGKYTFEISTRTDGVRGVWGIGIIMKKAEKHGQK